MIDPFTNLPRGHYGAILADPPWHFNTWGASASRNPKYDTMGNGDLGKMPVSELAAPDCVLFVWVIWPDLPGGLELVRNWGFTYKTCAFSWMKADARQMELYQGDVKADMTLGYWTRANSEVCLLATRGSPKRLSAAVRQGIIEPRREHSRKPDCVHGRIQQLVAGPYLELFARAPRTGWDVWGNQTDKFAEAAE